MVNQQTPTYKLIKLAESAFNGFRKRLALGELEGAMSFWSPRCRRVIRNDGESLCRYAAMRRPVLIKGQWPNTPVFLLEYDLSLPYRLRTLTLAIREITRLRMMTGLKVSREFAASRGKNGQVLLLGCTKLRRFLRRRSSRRLGLQLSGSHAKLTWAPHLIRRTFTSSWQRCRGQLITYICDEGLGVSQEIVAMSDYYLLECYRLLGLKPRPINYYYMSELSLRYISNMGDSKMLNHVDPVTGDIVTIRACHLHEIAHAAAWFLNGWPPMLLREALAQYLASVVLGIPLPAAMCPLNPRAWQSPKEFMRYGSGYSPGLVASFVVHSKGLPSFLELYNTATYHNLDQACTCCLGYNLDTLMKKLEASRFV